MRSLTPGQSSVLALPNRSVHVRVFVDRGGGDWVNLSDLSGFDWVVSVDYSENEDQPNAEASIQLKRRVENLSLVPFDDASKLNQGGVLVDAGKDIYVETAVIGFDQSPASGDWQEVFRGQIDRVSWGSDPIRLQCRDQSGIAMDRFIETQQKYPSDPATNDLLENVMQDILDDHLTGVTLYSENGTGGTPFNAADSPLWQLTEFYQPRDHVLTALRKLANMIGWDCKYRWQQNTNSFELQLYRPRRQLRDRGTITFTGIPAAGATITLNATIHDVVANGAGGGLDELELGTTVAETAQFFARDFLTLSSEKDNIQVWYTDTQVVIEWLDPGPIGVTFTSAGLTNATLDGSGSLGGTRAGTAEPTVDRTFNQDQYYKINSLMIDRIDVRNVVEVVYSDATAGRVTIKKEDSDSITKYGRRYMQVAEAGSSQIDTGAEANDLANAIMDDLREPTATHSVILPYFWPAEIGDRYTFEANDVHYDTDQTFYLVGVKHSLTEKKARTTLTCRGKASGGHNRWLEIEARRGLSTAADTLTPEEADNLGIEQALGSIIVTYDDPRSMSPPIKDWAYTECHVSQTLNFTPSAATRKAIGRQTRFEVHNLEYGVTYYVKLVIIDSSGNTGTISTEVTTATEQVGPYHTNPEQEFGILNQNPNFGIHTLPESNYPPDWWEVALSGSWGTSDGEWYFDSATQKTGDRSLKYNGEPAPGAGTQTRQFQSLPFLVQEDKIYVVDFAWQHDGNSGNKTAWVPRVQFFEDDKVTSVTTQPLVETIYTYTASGVAVVGPNTWLIDRGWVIAPANARYARITAYLEVNLGSLGQTDHPALLFDHFSISRSIEKLNVDQNAGTDRSVAGGVWQKPWFEKTPALDNASSFDPGDPIFTLEHQWNITSDGEYVIFCLGAYTAMASGRVLQARLLKNGTTPVLLSPPQTYNGAGAITVGIQSTGMQLTDGDTIQLELQHNDGVARSIDDSECVFRAHKVSDKGTG